MERKPWEMHVTRAAGAVGRAACFGSGSLGRMGFSLLSTDCCGLFFNSALSLNSHSKRCRPVAGVL